MGFYAVLRFTGQQYLRILHKSKVNKTRLLCIKTGAVTIAKWSIYDC